MSDKNEFKKQMNTPSQDRKPGQGNSAQGVERRLGSDTEIRGEEEIKKMKKGEGMGEQERTREGSQGSSRGQQEAEDTGKT